MNIDIRGVSSAHRNDLVDAAGKPFVVSRHLGYREIGNGIICDGWRTSGVFQNGRLVPGTRLHRQNAGASIPPRHVVCHEYADQDVVFIGVICACWGHVITDVIKHLWFVLDGLPERYRGMKFAYAKLIPDEKLPPNLYAVFSCLGIDLTNAIQVRGATRFRNVVVPDECFYSLEKPCEEIREATMQYSRLIDRIVANNVSGKQAFPNRSVYFSTSSFKKFDVGSNYLDESFRAAGYEVLRPETLTLREMINILQETKEFASTEGSCAHNSVFLPRNTHVTIVRKNHCIYWHQLAINLIRCLNVTYVDSYFAPWYTRYEIRAPKLGPCFLWCGRRLAGQLHVDSHFPFVGFCRYLAWGTTLCFGHAVCDRIRRFRAALINRCKRDEGV